MHSPALQVDLPRLHGDRTTAIAAAAADQRAVLTMSILEEAHLLLADLGHLLLFDAAASPLPLSPQSCRSRRHRCRDILLGICTPDLLTRVPMETREPREQMAMEPREPTKCARTSC